MSCKLAVEARAVLVPAAVYSDQQQRSLEPSLWRDLGLFASVGQLRLFPVEKQGSS